MSSAFPNSVCTPESCGLPLRRARGPRDLLLRMTIFGVALGAILVIFDSLFLRLYTLVTLPFDLSPALYHRVLVPLVCLVAVGGALALERAPAAGLLLIWPGVALAWLGAGWYLLPGAALATIWSVRRDPLARAAVGFLLLIPGVLAVYFSLAAALSLYAGEPFPGLPPGLDPPTNWTAALIPMRLLPAAILGAWLLLARE